MPGISSRANDAEFSAVEDKVKRFQAAVPEPGRGRGNHMRRIFWSCGLIFSLLVMVAHSVRSQSEPNKPGVFAAGQGKDFSGTGSAPDRAADEAAIRQNVAAFVRAYNVGDAKGVADLFMKDARIMDKEGNTSAGREAIQDTFAGIFKDAPQRRLEVVVDSIRFIGPDMAMEVGTTRETVAPGEPTEQDSYTVLHVKRDGKWLMALVRDAEGEPPTNHERLRPLAWLVGEWIDDGGSVVVFSTCRWSADGNFLLKDFSLKIAGRDALQVTQRIGWDPLAGRIRSWVFDSAGGFGESVWARNGDVWVIKATAVRANGTTASATNLLVRTGTDGYVWRSTDRVVGDEVVSPIEVKVVRKPPQPKP